MQIDLANTLVHKVYFLLFFLFPLSPAGRLKLREHLRNFRRGILLDGLTVEFDQLCHDPTQRNTTISKGCKEIIFALYIELFSY